MKENIRSLGNITKKLIIRPIGGTEDVNKTLTVYEYDDDIIIVDCGIGFPDIFEMPGVDILIPDFSYLEKNSRKVRGLFLTHGHEDHIGAVPYLLQRIPDIPIYSSGLVQEMLRSKFEEKSFNHLKEQTKLNLFNPTSGEVTLGNFTIKGFRVFHSIPESQGFAIKTPEGLLLHMGEYKIDPKPAMEKPMNLGIIENYGKQGVLCLLSDCLMAISNKPTKSESDLDKTYLNLFKKAEGRQLIVTMISSSISRMHQVINAAVSCGRKVVVSGRSVEHTFSIARKLGYISFPKDIFVPEKEASKLPQENLVYILTGIYGQYSSSLGRLSRNENRDITLKKNAMVIFSGDPAPPGTDITVEKLTDKLILLDAEVIHGGVCDNLHVSGHGARKDMERIAKLVNPKYFIPLGGSITRMRAYRDAMGSIGFSKNNVFECLEGGSVEFSGGIAKKGSRIETQQVYINTKTASKISSVVVDDREKMSDSGIFVVVIPRDRSGRLLPNKSEIVTRGFIYVKDSKELIRKAKKAVVKSISKRGNKTKDWSSLRRRIESDIQRFLYKEVGDSPVIIVHTVGL